MKKALIATGVFLVGLVAFFALRSSSSSSSSGENASASASKTDNGRRLPPPRRLRGEAGNPAPPMRYSGDGKRSEAPTKRYVRDDGTVVRNHRGGNREPNLTRRNTLPKELSKVQPETLRLVRLAMRPAMKECIATHAPEAPENSKAQAVLTVSIKNELLRVDELGFQTEGLSPESEAGLRECATAVMLGHEQPISG